MKTNPNISNETMYVAACICGDYDERYTVILGASKNKESLETVCKEFDNKHYNITEADMPYDSDTLRDIEDWIYDDSVSESDPPRFDPETGEILQMPEGYDLDMFCYSSELEDIIMDNWGKAFITEVTYYE